MAELRDNPRPDGYWPNTPNQWREPTVDDCTWYATEFAFEAASDNHISMHPVKDLRNKSIDREGGTLVRVALAETYRLWPKSENADYKYGAFSRTAIRRALKDGSTIVYGGDYEKLPPHYRRWTGNDVFDHAMASRDFRTYNGVEQTFLYDPLGGGRERAPYDGEWITLDALLRFNWDDGDGGQYVGIVYNNNRSDKMIKGNMERTSSKYVELPVGVAVYDSPNGEIFRRIRNPKRYDYFGFTENGWWAIKVWNNDTSSEVIGYIKKNLDYPRGDWPTAVEPPNEELTAALARIAELESSLSIIDRVTDEALEQSVVVDPLTGETL